MRFRPEEVAEDYYQLLGLSETATDADIRRAHRRAVAQVHPDLPGADRVVAEARTKRVNRAASVLLDPEGRAQHDRLRRARRRGPGVRRVDTRGTYVPRPSSDAVAAVAAPADPIIPPRAARVIGPVLLLTMGPLFALAVGTWIDRGKAAATEAHHAQVARPPRGPRPPPPDTTPVDTDVGVQPRAPLAAGTDTRGPSVATRARPARKAAPAPAGAPVPAKDPRGDWSSENPVTVTAARVRCLR